MHKCNKLFVGQLLCFLHLKGYHIILILFIKFDLVNNEEKLKVWNVSKLLIWNVQCKTLLNVMIQLKRKFNWAKKEKWINCIQFQSTVPNNQFR